MKNDFKPINVFEKLGIQEYAGEIIRAGNNSDISHLQGFIKLALALEKNNIDNSDFKIVFNDLVEIYKEEHGNANELYLDILTALKKFRDVLKNETI